MRSVALVGVLLVLVLVLSGGDGGRQVEAVTCSVSELLPCASAITSNTPPSRECCGKLREQRPCLCGYIRNPNLRQYVNSPNARKVGAACGVPYPQC